MTVRQEEVPKGLREDLEFHGATSVRQTKPPGHRKNRTSQGFVLLERGRVAISKYYLIVLSF